MPPQRPTCTNIRIRSTADAHRIFHAVKLKLLPIIPRRLDPEERKHIVSGNVFVWEERGGSDDAAISGMGIERWTDGFRWGPSRVRDSFLFYNEKEPDPHDNNMTKESKWNRMRRRNQQASSPGAAAGIGGGAAGGRGDPDRMIKQTYSVFLKPEPGKAPRKWHLTAYFTQGTVDSLGVVDDLPEIGSLVVPEGLYETARTGKQKPAPDHAYSGRTTRREAINSSLPSNHPMYAPYPSAAERAAIADHRPAFDPTSVYPEWLDPQFSGAGGNKTKRFIPGVSKSQPGASSASDSYASSPYASYSTTPYPPPPSTPYPASSATPYPPTPYPSSSTSYPPQAQSTPFPPPSLALPALPEAKQALVPRTPMLPPSVPKTKENELAPLEYLESARCSRWIEDEQFLRRFSGR